MPKMILLSTLQFDDVYSRVEEDHGTEIRNIARAYEAGVALPPILVDKETCCVVDGHLRIRAAEKLGIEKLPADFKVFKTAADRLEASIAANQHGRALSPYDKAHCIVLAARLGLSDVRLRAALCTTAVHLDELRVRKVGKDPSGKPMALKTTMQHMASGNTSDWMSKVQSIGHSKSTGMHPLMYVNQVINLLENDMIDRDNDNLREALRELQKLLTAFLRRKK